MNRRLIVQAALLSGLLCFALPAPAPGFKQAQLRHPKVRIAFSEKEAVVKALFAARGLPFPNSRLFFRAFKAEAELELWAAPAAGREYLLVKTYPICAASGRLGPKRKQGDLQVPEGVYNLDSFNPFSNFFLSMRISYPNASDRKLGDPVDPGGTIYMHGNCVTIGCLPMTDDGIKELYLIAVEAKNGGQKKIPIHLFPTRMNEAGRASLAKLYHGEPAVHAFWRQLQPIYDHFETRRQPPVVKIDRQGNYFIAPSN